MNWHNEKRKINDLIPYSANPRQMTEKQVEDLKKSLEKFDLVEIPAINTDNTILAGHQRLKIMQLLGRGEEDIDVRVPDRLLTHQEVKEYNIRSNKNTGQWDFEILANNFEIPDLLEWGFDDKELKIDSNVKEDDPPPADDINPPVAKVGDVYQLGNHRLMCGDSTKIEDIEKLMDGKKADMVFTDPPYALFGNSTGVAGVADDKMIRPFFGAIFRNMRNLVKMFGHLYVCCDWHSAFVLQDMFRETGLRERNLCIWDKGSGGVGAYYQNCYEMIWLLSNSPQAKTTGTKIKGERLINGRPNIWRFNRANSNREHNAQKPVEMCAQSIECSSDIEQIVVDLFGGSGSTLIACEQFNRRCYMMELDPKYVDVIIKRWEKYTGERAQLIQEIS